MTQQKGTILLSSEEVEEEMARLKCIGCSQVWEVVAKIQGRYPYVMKDVVTAVVTCSVCGKSNPFELTQDAIATPGRLVEASVVKFAASTAKASLEVAERCFYGNAFRAVPGMCRSAIEEALDEKGVKTPSKVKSDLFGKIKVARTHGILDATQEMQATAARLIGKYALHHQMQVSQVQAMNLISTSIDLINHIAERKPVPASQRGTDSNET